MAQILCDCGCGETITKIICVNNAHRMRYVRNQHKPQESVQETHKDVQITHTNDVREDAQDDHKKCTDFDFGVNEAGFNSCKICGNIEVHIPFQDKWKIYAD